MQTNRWNLHVEHTVKAKEKKNRGPEIKVDIKQGSTDQKVKETMPQVIRYSLNILYRYARGNHIMWYIPGHYW